MIKSRRLERKLMMPALALAACMASANVQANLVVGVIGAAGLTQSAQYSQISDSLQSFYSLEQSGVRRFQLRIRSEKLKVNFANNQMSERLETLVFQPGAAVRELDGAHQLYTENLSLPYCLLRLERRWQGQSNGEVKLEAGTQRSFDRWLPGMLRYSEHYTGSGVLHQLFLPVVQAESSDALGRQGVVLQELECHMTDEDLRNETMAEVLARVLGKHIEITYSLE